ncbi:MAG TPA: undecaprenyl-phosphate glucose phosphotransferase [Gammaproteobacteria bacterium]|nr:undecaprenyl-phosphate glucose phosphotransferase [Gammaproteobacteria bacterium]
MSLAPRKRSIETESSENESDQRFRRIRKSFTFPEDSRRDAERRNQADRHEPLRRPILQRRSSLFSTIQALADAMLVGGLGLGMSWLQFGGLPREYLALCVLLLMTMGIVYDRMGVYRYFRGVRSKSILLLKAWSAVFGFLLSVGFLLKTSAFYSRQYLLLLYTFGYGLQLAAHWFGYQLVLKSRDSRDQKNALVIGSGQLARYLHEKINSNPWLPEKVVGLIKAEKEYAEFMTSDINKEEESDSVPILGAMEDVLQLVEEKEIRVVYFAVPLDSSPLVEKLYLNLLDKNVDVHWAPNIFGMNLVNYSVKELSGVPIITLSESPIVGVNLIIKTVEDRMLALLGLIVASPVLLLAALAIKLDSRGPVFFLQERTGWDGRRFRIIKFRTMKVMDAGDGFVRQATRDDPRITRVGAFLRRTSIDELPQLFNVLLGSMSLVGPRPHAVSHNLTYSERIEAYLARHRIKPGITGLAQVRGYRGETKDLTEMIKRVESDLEYINNWSLWLDMKILFKTMFALKSEKAY